MNVATYLIPIFTSVVSAMLVFVLQSVVKENHRLKKENEDRQTQEESALKDAVLCLLRVKLIEHHSKYVVRGKISAHGLENWLLMYKAYKALGGNGMIDHMKNEIEALPIQ